MKGITSLIHFFVVWTISPGKEDAFAALASAAIDRVRQNEPDALEYAWHFTADRRTCSIVETYRNPAAAQFHVRDVADIVDQLAGVASVARFEVFGNLTSEAAAELLKNGATIVPRWDGIGDDVPPQGFGR